MISPSVVVGMILWVLAATATATPDLTDRVEGCLPCEGLFSKLEAGPDGRLSQVVEIQQRGEPKSGTTLMWSWARTTLAETCTFLGSIYGSETCKIVFIKGQGTQLEFNPQVSGANNSPCSCETIERVSISVTMAQKHELPVETSCPWWHPDGVAPRKTDACDTLGGEILNLADLWSCIGKAGCKLTDNRLQFAQMRDPRAITVSEYFYTALNAPKEVMNTTVDQYMWDNLPRACQWIALRHILFEGLLAKQSSTSWYEDAISDPVGWHFEWMHFAGLHLPATAVENIAQTSIDGALHFINKHPGGQKASTERTWKNEVSVDVVDGVDEILRAFLPPLLLARWGVTE